MTIYSVYDPEFAAYGKVLEGYDTAALCEAMKSIAMPESGTAYQPSIPVLEETAIYGKFQNQAYGGMPVQLGMCWGYNTKLNCLEYHRDSEINIGAEDFILLLARNKWLLAHPESSEAAQGAYVGLRGENIDLQ